MVLPRYYRFPTLGILLLLLSCVPDSNVSGVSESSIGQSDTTEDSLFPLHSAFDFNEEDLMVRLPGLPDPAPFEPERFLELASSMLAMPAGYLSLVDKSHSLPDGYTPEEIVSLTDYSDLILSRRNLELDKAAAEALAELSRMARKDGVELSVSSAYRSFDYQKALFERYVLQDGEEAASRYSARPGTSQHQLGTTVDLGNITNSFAGSDSGIWMEKNAAAGGWSLSYPEGAEEETGYRWESWHWRWIGKDAIEMQERYFDGSQQALLKFWDTAEPILREARRIER